MNVLTFPAKLINVQIIQSANGHDLQVFLLDIEFLPTFFRIASPFDNYFTHDVTLKNMGK